MSKEYYAVVDVDDTLADLGSLLYESLNRNFGKSFSYHDFTSFNIADLYGITWDEFCGAILNDRLLELAQPFEGVQGALERLCGDHRVVISTARSYHPKALEITRNWMEEHRLPYHDIQIAGHGLKKSQLFSAKYSGKASVLFDDGLHNVQDFQERELCKAYYIPRHPWNELEHSDNVHRVSSFPTAVSMYYVDYVEGR